jgi:hypothetical protein
MLRDGFERAVHEDGAPTWAATGGRKDLLDWQVVDQELRTIAQRRAALDAEEARWLREAEGLQIWLPLAMVSMLGYVERRLGYAPRTAQDRLRVARALGSLPELTAALERGELLFSAVRELTRVATPATEGGLDHSLARREPAAGRRPGGGAPPGRWTRRSAGSGGAYACGSLRALGRDLRRDAPGAAIAVLGDQALLESLIIEALRHCPRPRSKPWTY